VSAFALVPRALGQDQSRGFDPPAEDACADLDCALPDEAIVPVDLRAVSSLARPRPVRPIVSLGVAALEELLFVGVGATWYFNAESNEFDWDRPPFRDRFTHAAVRMDNNTHPINFLWHPLSGAAYYGFPRGAGLNIPASFAMGLSACLFWEYGLEFREKVSINDIITTPVTGVALGEFFSRLAFYLNRAPGGGTRAQRALGVLLGPSQSIHDAMYGVDPVDANAMRDALGYDAAIAHRFELGYGLSLASAPGGERAVNEVSIEGRFVAIEGFLEPGLSHGFFGDGNATRLRLSFRGGPDVVGTTIDADTVLLGYRHTNVRADANGARRGFGLLVGSSVAYFYRRDSMPGYVDRLGTTRLPGVAVDLDALTPRARWFVSGRFHADFAGITSLAFDEWRDEHPSVRTKTILEREGYYYGWGFSSRIEARVETRFVSVRGGFDVSRFDSIEGWDRSQEIVELDARGADRIRESELAVRVTPWTRPRAFLELGYHGRYRRSRLEDTVREVRLARGDLRIGVSF